MMMDSDVTCLIITKKMGPDNDDACIRWCMNRTAEYAAELLEEISHTLVYFHPNRRREMWKMVKQENVESPIVHDMHAAVEAQLRKIQSLSVERKARRKFYFQDERGH